MPWMTTLDERGIRQTSLIDERAGGTELRSARVTRLAGAHRLPVRTDAGRFKVFSGDTPTPSQAFARVAVEDPAGAAGTLSA